MRIYPKREIENQIASDQAIEMSGLDMLDAITGVEAELTTNHAFSSYGRPVLVATRGNGEQFVFGTGDIATQHLEVSGTDEEIEDLRQAGYNLKRWIPQVKD